MNQARLLETKSLNLAPVGLLPQTRRALSRKSGSLGVSGRVDFFARRVSNQPTKWSTSKSGRRSIACSISTRVLIMIFNCKKKAGANQVFCESQFGEKGEKERAGITAMRGSFSPKMKKNPADPSFPTRAPLPWALYKNTTICEALNTKNVTKRSCCPLKLPSNRPLTADYLVEQRLEY